MNQISVAKNQEIILGVLILLLVIFIMYKYTQNIQNATHNRKHRGRRHRGMGRGIGGGRINMFW